MNREPTKQPELGDIFRRRFGALKADLEMSRLNDVENLRIRLAKQPTEPAAYRDLAAQLIDIKEIDEAILVLQRGCGCVPTTGLYAGYIGALAKYNRTEEALAVASEGVRLFPENLLLRIKEALILPIVYDTQRSIDHYRERFSTRLRVLDGSLKLETPEQRADAASAIRRHDNFYLGYQMQDDRELQKRYSGFVRRIVEASYPNLAADPARPQRAGNRRIRVGYISASLRNFRSQAKHSVAKTFAGWISGQDTDRFEVFVYNSSRSADLLTEHPEGVEHYRPLPRGVAEACARILADRLDVLIFLDVGMAPRLTPLSCIRLAPTQCVTWGHPITTGSSQIDFFLSSELMEAADADKHYSERLVRLPGIGMDYSRPFIPLPMLNCERTRFGFREGSIIYLCCQSIHKYLPDHDDVFARIAERVPTAQFVFLRPNSAMGDFFGARLCRAFDKIGLNSEEHCIFLPKVGILDYWALNLACDIFLDSLDWSGCNSTMEAIACRLPVVTLPGRFMRGRHSFAILTQMGLPETIARDKEDFINIAVQLGLDRDWRKLAVSRLVERESRIYSDKRSTAALEEFITRTVL